MASINSVNNSVVGTSSNTSCSSNSNMAGGDSRWYFSAEQLANSPSRKQGIDADEELSFRQMTAYLIQEMGQRLQVSQLCINTAIVYMHRFYAFHSFTHFQRNGIAAASLFLAAKVEEQPRKLEHVIKAAHLCLNQDPPVNNTEVYAEQAQELVFNENVLLQTLGFDVAIDHPHTHVVKTCHLVKACKDLAQTSYFLASNSLHLTSMCLQYRPTVVACFCIYLACKWSRWEIPQSTEGKHWFHYVDKTVTMDLLQQLTNEFIAIYEKSPARLKSKLNSVKAIAQGARIPESSNRNIPDSSNASVLPQQLVQASSGSTQQQSTSTASSISSRRLESSTMSHTSHHRSHHAGVQHPHHHHHHHHSKHTTNTDLTDHKQQTKPYPVNNSNNHSNRTRTDRAHLQTHSIQSAVNNDLNNQYSANKQIPSKSNNSSGNSRSGMPAIPNTQQPQLTAPQQPLSLASSSGRQNLPLHDIGYHKNRVNPSSGNLPNSINQQMSSNHKILCKSQNESSNKSLTKDGTVRDVKIPVKHGSLTSGGTNLYSQQQSVGLDMTRNVLQQQQNQQKGFTHNSGPSGSQPAGNFQQQINSRTSSVSTGSNSNLSGIKYEQSVQQQALIAQLQQKQGIDSSSHPHTSTTNTQSTAYIQNNLQVGNDHMDICSPPRYSTSQIQLPTVPQAKPFLSIFSPDYNEKQQQLSQQLPQLVNNSINSNSNKPIFNSKVNRESPKKEKRSGTPKKDKRSEIHFATDQQKAIDKRAAKNYPTSQNIPPAIPTNTNYAPQISQSQQLQVNELNLNVSKRASSIKIEEATGRENKVRKIDQHSIEVRPPSFLFDQLAPNNQSNSNSILSTISNVNIAESNKTKPFPSTINGLETNPDLVSSLLKESLCNESKYTSQPSLTKTDKIESQVIINSNCTASNTFIKTEPKLSPIQSGFNINPMETLPQELLQNSTTFATPFINIKQEPNQFEVSSTSVLSNSGLTNPPPLSQSFQIQQKPLQLEVENADQYPLPQQLSQNHLQTLTQQSQNEHLKSKSEKKKKKEKHKHKEKDKSKDKEERKKHKKDKDKHKDKDRDRNSSVSEISEPVKLKISIEKLNLTPKEAINVSPGQLKIKIPKERIKTEINNSEKDNLHGTFNQSMPQMPLKIKISKDKIGSYGHENLSLISNQHLSSSGSLAGNSLSNNLPALTGNIESGVNSNKKKERDKERDKEKKRNNEINKHNGTGGNSGNSGFSGSTSKSNSNKIQYSHLFGDSNDEDDDSDSGKPQQPHHKNFIQNSYSSKTNFIHNNMSPNSNFGITNNNLSSNISKTGSYHYNIKKLINNNYSNSNQHSYQQNYK